MSFLAVYRDVVIAMHMVGVKMYRDRTMLLGVTAMPVPAPPILHRVFPDYADITLTYEALERMYVLKDYITDVINPESKNSMLNMRKTRKPTADEQAARVRLWPEWRAMCAEFDRQLMLLCEADDENYLAVCNLFEDLLHSGILLLSGGRAEPCPTRSRVAPGGIWADLRRQDCERYNTQQYNMYAKLAQQPPAV